MKNFKGSDSKVAKKGAPAKEDKEKKPSTNGYFAFQKEKRDQLKKDNPKLDNKALMTKISDLWKKLSDKEKEKYLKIANSDKSKLEIEKKDASGGKKKSDAKGAKKPAAKGNAKKGKKSEDEGEDQEDDEESGEGEEEDEGEDDDEEEAEGEE